MDTQEDARVLALKVLRILDTPAEERFDRVTRLAVALFGVPMAMVNLVDHERQWVKSCNLVMGDSVPRAHTVCHHTVQGREPLIVPNLSLDARVAQFPAVAGPPHFRFYAGVPLRTTEGFAVGALCLVGHDQLQRIQSELLEHQTFIQGVMNTVNAGIVALNREGKVSFKLDMAQKAVARLMRLTNELLDDERLRLGESALKQDACNTMDLFSETLGAMGGMANKAKVQLHAQGESIDFTADRDRLLQVLTNLVGNAVKFSPEGGQVTLDAAPDGKRLLMSVSDEGRGIPEDKLEAIFERFTQVEEADASIKGGSGLGLAICRSIVKRHGGKIWAENRPEGGSRFVFSLPLNA